MPSCLMRSIFAGVDGLARELRSAAPPPAVPGTNIAVGVCHGAPASLSPSPRAWPAELGAADMPIGCALAFSSLVNRVALTHGAKPSSLGRPPQKNGRD